MYTNYETHRTRQKQGFKAFIPHPFPPKEGFDWDLHLVKKTDQATRLLGKLDGIAKLLPDADFFLLMGKKDF